jgi:hypothetical protein
MTSAERSREIVSAILDICRVEVGEKRPQLESLVAAHLDEIERRAAEKAVVVIREKTTEATDKVLSKTGTGAPEVGEPPAQAQQPVLRD